MHILWTHVGILFALWMAIETCNNSWGCRPWLRANMALPPFRTRHACPALPDPRHGKIDIGDQLAATKAHVLERNRVHEEIDVILA
jgi:hypothetical protein